MTATTVDTRLALCRAMRAEINLWDGEFASTSYAIPRAVLDRKLSQALVLAYPLTGPYPERLSRGIAHAVGLPFADDKATYSSGGWLLNVSAEGIHAVPLHEAN